MAKMISRTFTRTKVTIRSSKPEDAGKVIKSYETLEKVKREKVAVAYIKETKDTYFTIDINEVDETREMTVDCFLANSKVVEATKLDENKKDEVI